MREKTLEKYSLRLFDLARDVAAIYMDADLSKQAEKLRDRAVYLIYLMNAEEAWNELR